MRAIAIILCVIYAVSAQDPNPDPNLVPAVNLPGGFQQGQTIQVQGRDDSPAAQGQDQFNQNQNQGQDASQNNGNQATNTFVDARNLRPSYVVQPQRPSVVVSTYQQRPQQAAYVQTQNQGQNAQVQDVSIGAVEASRQQIAAAVQQGANPNHFGIQTNAHFQIAQAPNPQNPVVWVALDNLRGRNALTIDEILNILANAVAGRDYPIYNDIPATRFSCENVKQAGFYADPEAQCQVIRRCDINGVLWSYLCPNMTMFNQITLVCDWFFNVNCNNAVQFYDYSNPRLYTQFALLDSPAEAQSARPVYQTGFVLANQPQPVYRNQG